MLSHSASLAALVRRRVKGRVTPADRQDKKSVIDGVPVGALKKRLKAAADEQGLALLALYAASFDADGLRPLLAMIGEMASEVHEAATAELELAAADPAEPEPAAPRRKK